jgi:hypothetical protein
MKTNRIVATALVACMFVLTAPQADARALPAFGRKPLYPAEATCFSAYYSGVYNNCAGPKAWFIPLVVDPAGYYHAIVVAYSPNSSRNVGCAAVGVSNDISTYYGGKYAYLPAFGSSQSLHLDASVPGGGSLYAVCYLDQGTRVSTVVW